MLGVAAFVAFWVIVALGLFFLAMRGGGGRPAREVGRRSTGITLALFVVCAAVFGVGLPLAMVIGNHANASAQVGGIQLNGAQKQGRELFGEHCGVCHTLAAANAVGHVGPNLDILKPAESVILHTLANGCEPNAAAGSAQSCLGQGVMPADVVQGHDAQDVASFVAKVAGNE